MENKYQRSKIYQLVCNDGYYYIGSTTQDLKKRLTNHKNLADSGVNKAYKYINSIGWNNVEIKLIEEYPCISKKELNEREKYYLTKSKLDDLCLNFKDNNIYENGKIYKLICNDGSYYFGSTTQKLYRRLNHHKEASKIGTSVVYRHINNIGWDKVKIELVEDYPCTIKSELNKREEYYINLSKSDELCLNYNRAYVSEETRKTNMKKYYEENREAILEYHREYNEENRDVINQKLAEYRKKNAEILNEKQKEYAKNHAEQIKTKRKEYYENNKEIELEKQKEYAEKNKEKIQQYKNEWAKNKRKQSKEEKIKNRELKKQARIEYDNTIILCECGGSYQNYHKQRHDISKKHQKYVVSLTI